MEPVIDIRDLGKKYSIRQAERYLSLRDTLTGSVKNVFRKNNNSHHDFWALKDINLKVEKGERLGIIGRNGAGKSTLLKILSRITWPSKGTAIIRGRLASLLEVGTGFHPELTGKENIYLNGAILGLRKQEIDHQFDAIVDFSGVASFLETPLKNYSSGMQLRLAFAVAAHLEPEVLLIDEVLAVGDMEFQRKCIGKMEEVSRQEGRTILFVSHNMNQLRHLCRTAILLNEGQIHFKGDINDAIREYSSLAGTIESHQWQNNEPDADHAINSIRLLTNGKILESSVSKSDDLSVEINLGSRTTIENSIVAIRVTNQENIPVYTTTNADDSLRTPSVDKGLHTYRVKLPVHLLIPGRYSLIVSWNIPGIAELSKVEDKLYFDLTDDLYPADILRDGRLGVINKTITWEKL
ncbi:MAG: ATP-binding cassette domain-containing protein [Chitinophagaceae bacterium]|nr:ATP-binding cassette domain-containing protein [Chitinophagaceae bacterium]